MAVEAYTKQGQFSPQKIAAILGTTSNELAQSLGLSRDAIQRKECIASDRSQRRMREVVEVLNEVEPGIGSALLAYAWYRSEPLPDLYGQTAMQLVHENRAQDVLTYIEAIGAGVHA